MVSDRMEEYNRMRKSLGDSKKSEEKIASYLAQARMQLDRGRLTESRQYIERVLKMSPDNREAQELLDRLARLEEEGSAKQQIDQQKKEAVDKAEEAKIKEQEALQQEEKVRKIEEEAEAHRYEEERLRGIEEEALRKVAEARKAAEEAEAKRKEAEGRRKAEEESRKKAEEEARQKAEEARKKAEEAKRLEEEEALRKAEEEALRKAEEEARKKEEEERKKREEEARRRAKEEAETRQRAEQITKLVSQARMKLDNNDFAAASERAKKALEIDEGSREALIMIEKIERAEEEAARRKEEEEAKRKAEEEAKRKAEEEAKRKAEEEAKRKAEEEAKRKAEEEAKRKVEEEAKRKAEEEAKRKAEEEARRKAEEEARRKAEQISEYLKKAIERLGENQFDEAREEVKRARSINDQIEESSLLLNKIDEVEQAYIEELEKIRKAEEEAKRKAKEEEARRNAEEEAKRKDAAEKEKRAKEIEHHLVQAKGQLGSGHFDHAKEEVAKAFELEPGHPGGQALIEEINREEKAYREGQEKAKAEEEGKARKKEARIRIEQIKAHLKQAEGQLKGKQFDRAKEEVGKALEIEGDCAEAKDLLARINKIEEDVKAEVEAKRQGEEQEKTKAEAEAKRKAEEKEKAKAEAEAKRKAEEKEKAKAEEEEAKRKAEEQEKKRVEEEAKRKAEEEEKTKAAAEAKKKDEDEAKRESEEEAKRKAEEEAKRQAEREEAKTKAVQEVAKKKIEEEAKRKADREAKEKAEEKSRQEAEETRRRAQEKIRKEPVKTDQEEKQGILLSKFTTEKKLEASVTSGGVQPGMKKKEEVKKTEAKPRLNLSTIFRGGGSLKKIDFKKIDFKKIKKNYIWIILGILVVTFALAHTVGKLKQVFVKTPEGEQETTQFAETIPVKVYKVKPMDFKDTLPVLGRIEGFKKIELRFHESGILESFNFEEGEKILEGDIIASLDQKDSLLKLKYASLEMEKSQRLLEIGGVDKMAADQKKLEYESAKRDLEKTNIYAPSDGYLGSKEVHTGALVTPQEKIGVFVDFVEVYASFDVIEEDSPKLELGQNAEIFLDSYPGASYAGTVDMIAPMIEGRTRTQKVKIELSNEEDELRPGMFARAIINTYEKKDALIIPASAFKKVENKYFVYIVHPDEEEVEGLVEEEGLAEDADLAGSQTGTVEEREIKIEYLTHDVAEVGEGLKEGELVIRELHQEYKDQDKVEITEIQETIF